MGGVRLTFLSRRRDHDPDDGHGGAGDHERECLRIGDMARFLRKSGEIILIQDARGNASDDGHDSTSHLPAQLCG